MLTIGYLPPGAHGGPAAAGDRLATSTTPAEPAIKAAQRRPKRSGAAEVIVDASKATRLAGYAVRE